MYYIKIAPGGSNFNLYTPFKKTAYHILSKNKEKPKKTPAPFQTNPLVIY